MTRPAATYAAEWLLNNTDSNESRFMEKQEHTSKWDELARELGAEIPPEIEQREATVAAYKPPLKETAQSPADSSETLPPPPKKIAADWDSLAGELGLPPAPAEEKSAKSRTENLTAVLEESQHEEPRRIETRRPEGRRQESGRHEEREQEPPRETTRHEPPRRQVSAGRRQERPPREDRGEQRNRRERSGNRGNEGGQRGGNRRTPRDVDSENEADREIKPAPEVSRESRAEQRPESPAPVREEPPKPAAVSLWHKIFGSPAEQTAKLTDEPNGPEVSNPIEMRDEPREAGSGFVDPHADEAVTEGDRLPASTEERESSDRPRGRSRRRRGRGRGRRSESEREEGRSNEGRTGEPRSGPSRGRQRPRPTERDERKDNDRFAEDELDDDLDSDDPLAALANEADDSEDGDEVPVGAMRGRSALQRAIPTWDEAIGFIVDSNMESRSQRRPPSRTGPRDGGRGRGGRGRRKPQ